MPADSDNRSLGQMFADLSRDTRTLIQQEVELARTELLEKAHQVARGAALIVAGAFLAYSGLLALVAALVLALVALALPAWAAALVIAIVLAGAGYLLVRSGLTALRPETLKPRDTLESLKEDAQWLKSQTK